MIEFVLSVIIIGVVFIGLSIGVLAGRKPIGGSCGGLSSIGLEGECEICGAELSGRDSGESKEHAPGSDLGYEVR